MLGATENFAAVVSGDGLPLGYLLVVLAVYSGVGSLVGVAIGIGCQRIDPKNDIPFQEAFVWLTTGLTVAWAADKSITAATFRTLPFWVGPLVLVCGLAIAALAVRRFSSRALATIDCEASLAIAVGAVIGWLAVGRFVAVQLFGSFGSVPGLVFVAISSGFVLALVRVQGRLVRRLPRISRAGAGTSFALAAALATGVTTSASLPRVDRSAVERNSSRAQRSAAPGSPNIVLVILDTLRMDRLSLYGYERETSPNLERLASDALVFTHAASPPSWTLPAHASIFTGRYPRQHGAHFVDDWQSASDEYPGARPLSPQNMTLAEILSLAGYQTAGFSSNFALVSRGMGMDQGFQWFDDRQGRRWGFEPTLNALWQLAPHIAECLSMSYRPAQKLNDSIFEWVAQQRGPERPFFLFVNYMDPHSPYCPPTSFRDTFPGGSILVSESSARQTVFEGRKVSDAAVRHFEAMYDGELVYVDAELGRLLDKLKSMGFYDDALIVVTSDVRSDPLKKRSWNSTVCARAITEGVGGRGEAVAVGRPDWLALRLSE